VADTRKSEPGVRASCGSRYLRSGAGAVWQGERIYRDRVLTVDEPRRAGGGPAQYWEKSNVELFRRRAFGCVHHDRAGPF